MISPQSTLVSFAGTGTGPSPAGTAGEETALKPLEGADFSPWVALALGAEALPTPAGGVPLLAQPPSGDEAPPVTGGTTIGLLPGGNPLPLQVAGLPPAIQGATAAPKGREPAAGVNVAREPTAALAATLALEPADDTMQWASGDDSIDIDVTQIEISKQLPDATLPRRQMLQSTSMPDGAVPDRAWHAVLGDAAGASQATTARGTSLPEGQPLPATPSNQADFDQAVSQRMVWMLRNGHQDAQLKVHPEHLGSIDIQLKMDGDDARLSLTAASHVVRDALETAVPRLRELLNDAGLNLTQVDVETGERGQSGSLASDGANGENHAAEPEPGDEPAAEARPVAMRAPAGIVDTFA